MSHAYVVEIEQDAVGFVVRESSGYRFYAAKRSFNTLQRRIFDTAHLAHHAVLDLHGRSAATLSSLTPLHFVGHAEGAERRSDNFETEARA